jgi:hypothetical protein
MHRIGRGVEHDRSVRHDGGAFGLLRRMMPGDEARVVVSGEVASSGMGFGYW